MEIVAWLIIAGAVYYFWRNYGNEVKKRFWMWITEKSPYFKVSKEFSLTDKALRKYTSEALIRKVMQLEAQVEKLTNELMEYQQKMQAHKKMEEVLSEQEREKIEEVAQLPTILAPYEPIKVYDADGVFRGYLEGIKGSFSEAYIIVRTPENERLIFGPDELTNLIWSEQSFADQIRSGTLIIAYDRYNRKVTPIYTKVEV